MDGLSPNDVSKHLMEEGVDEEVANIILEAGVNGSSILELERDDLRDLLPGSQMFSRRKDLWRVIAKLKGKNDLERPEAHVFSSTGQKRTSAVLCDPSQQAPTSNSCSLVLTPATGIKKSEQKTPQQMSCGSSVVSVAKVNFAIYSDTDLLACASTGQTLAADVRNRLVRSQVSIVRAECSSLVPPREPTAEELCQVAKKLVTKYPILRDATDLNPEQPWGAILKQMQRRLSNVKPTKKPQGRVPNRSKTQRILSPCTPPASNNRAVELQGSSSKEPAITSCSTELIELQGATASGGPMEGPMDLQGATKLQETSELQGAMKPQRAPSKKGSSIASSTKRRLELEGVPTSKKSSTAKSTKGALTSGIPATNTEESSLQGTFSKEASSHIVAGSTKSQLKRHYDQLQEQFKMKTPNAAVLTQLLRLELPRRRDFVENLSGDIASRVSTFLKAYPCFKSVQYCLSEVRCLVAPDDPAFVETVLSKMDKMWDQLVFYGLHLQAMKPPSSFDTDTKVRSVLKACQDIFPSKKGNKDGLFKKLSSSEEPDVVIKNTAEPRIIEAGESLIIAVGGKMLTPLRRGEWSLGILGLLAVYYTFNLNYPAGQDVFLLFIQTRILNDNIHPRDKTTAYKLATSNFDKFSH